jgi:hypothetical protein
MHALTLTFGRALENGDQRDPGESRMGPRDRIYYSYHGQHEGSGVFTEYPFLPELTRRMPTATTLGQRHLFAGLAFAPRIDEDTLLPECVAERGARDCPQARPFASCPGHGNTVELPLFRRSVIPRALTWKSRQQPSSRASTLLTGYFPYL